jgi:hypothetical protein
MGIVAGGLLAMGITGALLVWLPGKLFPGLETSPALAYLLYLAAAVVGFGLWPRLWQVMVGRPRESVPLQADPMRS